MKKSSKLLIILLSMAISLSAFAGCTSGRTPSEASEDSMSGAEASSQSSTVDETPFDPTSRPSLQQAKDSNSQKNPDEIELVQFEEPNSGDLIATISTSEGDMTFVLYPQYAPDAVENFMKLAESDWYVGKVFHFTQDGYMIRGGAINSNGTGSHSALVDENGQPANYAPEPDWNLWHFRGALSMAASSDGTNGSQFVVVQAPEIYHFEQADLEEAAFPQKVIERYASVGGIPHRDGVNTVFGMMVEGFDVLDTIAEAEANGETGEPTVAITILSVSVEPFENDGTGTQEPSDDTDPSDTEPSQA